MAPHVLVVEDDEASRQLISYLLRARDHEVSEADDGEVALELARTRAPALIVMDVHMPNMDGYEAVHILKADAVLRSIPVLAVTALAMVGDRERVLAAGFDGYLSKPIEPSELLQAVDALLRAGSERRVLLVDNIGANRRLMSTALSVSGLSVVTAATVEAAFECAVADVPDLILCDVDLGRASGHELLQQVRAEPALRTVPFVLFTSSVVDDDASRRAIDEGATALVERPLEPLGLRALVAAHLEV